MYFYLHFTNIFTYFVTLHLDLIQYLCCFVLYFSNYDYYLSYSNQYENNITSTSKPFTLSSTKAHELMLCYLMIFELEIHSNACLSVQKMTVEEY